MGQYHRNDDAGPQKTSMKKSGVPITMTFRSLRADFEKLRKSAPAGVVDQSVVTLPDKSEQGKDIHVIRIGKNPSMPVLMVGCHHAREWISVEVPYLFAEFLVNNYGSDPRVKRIVDACDIWIIPMLNPDGHEHSVLVDRDWRKNRPKDPSRPSVDLNRNYETAQWNITKGAFSDTASDETFRGKTPGFALEVIALQNLIKKQKFKGLYDFHSFGRDIMYPWFGRTDPPPDQFQREMALHVKRVIDAKGKAENIEYEAFQGVDLYVQAWGVTREEGRMPGNLKDFMIETVPEAIVTGLELEPASGDPRGFSLPESEIESTFNLHKAAMLTFLNCLDTIKKPVETAKLLLKEGKENNLVVFQPECWRALANY